MLARTAIGVLPVALALTSACRKSPQPPAPSDADAASCAAACAALVRGQCVIEGAPEGAEARCAAACAQRSHELAPARCEAERRAYIDCVGRAAFDCRPLSCSASVCLEQGLATASCAADFARFKTCVAPCLQAGTTHVGARTVEVGGARREVKTELVRSGCEPCSKTKAGAGEGAPCEAHSVCAQSCCRCPNGRSWFLAKTCADGRCAAGEVACSLGRAAAPVDPCSNDF
jgi:hypothetical protein